MTALNGPHNLPAEFQPLAARLEEAGSRFRLAAVAGGLGRFLAVAVPSFTLALFLIGFFKLSSWLNIALILAAAAAAVFAYAAFIHPSLWRRPSYGQIARWIEQEAQTGKLELSNELINAVLLAQEYQTSGEQIARRELNARRSPWIPHVLAEIAKKTESLPLTRAVPWARHRTSWYWAAGMIALALFLVAISPGSFAHAFSVLSRPGAFVPRVGKVKIPRVDPGNDTMLAGQPITFQATVESPDNQVVPVKIDLDIAGKKSSYDMTAWQNSATDRQYTFQPIWPVTEGFTYHITAGDTESDQYEIKVQPQIRMLSYRLDIEPPAYTHLAARKIVVEGKDLTPAKGSLDIPVGSTVTVTVSLDMPVHEVILDLGEGKLAVLVPAADNKIFSTTLLLKDTLKFGVQINDQSTHAIKRFPEPAAKGEISPDHAGDVFTLTAIPDSPPTVAVTTPARDLDAKPGDSIPLAAQANDEYGLTQMTLELALGKDADFKAAQTWPVKPAADGAPTHAYTLRHTLALPAATYKFGDVLRYRFTATDNRDLSPIGTSMGPQTVVGQVYTITFNDTAAAAAKSSKAWDALRAKLNELLDKQITLHSAAHTLPGGREARNVKPDATTLAGYKATVSKIDEGQKGLRSDMQNLAKGFPFEPSMKLIQKSLEVLAVEDATSAVDRAGDIALLSDPKAFTPLATKLRTNQARIIDVLQTLLAIAKAEQEKSTQVADKEGGDVPNEAKKKWEKLKDELEDFKKEQKQVIDSTADLAKKPKDDFSKDDDKKIKDAAAVEDKWEKFLSNRLADMSKVAEQDQANVSLLDEMVQMKVELAMAKAALEQKATEIATPLEENGLENAKALTTHIEKWLMQQPDRTQWKMEEPVAQNDPKMAELPKQLQDMMGDLMDQEEDITDQMENLGSKFADSLDKGAGWDAAEGPISNMSAQGVTGNQMPKDTEIQGRSGEGREGRSSGEFVGAEAEGKGGRKTPTRMTPEPFSSGKVDDKSTDPAGGATGGGKKGGFGGEGLEGPAPQEMQDTLQRLQGKQAAIRNETERLELQMKANNFDNFKLLEANILMRKSEEALRAYQYNTAMYYQKEAVQSLNTAKVLASGQINVNTDTSPTMSPKTEKEMQDALNGVMPKGYADPVKAYFLKLSQDAGKE